MKQTFLAVTLFLSLSAFNLVLAADAQNNTNPQSGQSQQKKMNLAALPECVDHENTCVLNGTECCDYPQYKCQGTFPNTTCQPASN